MFMQVILKITHAIRGTSVTENVSRISAMPEIRQELMKLQHFDY